MHSVLFRLPQHFWHLWVWTALPPVLSKPGKDTSANFLLRLDGQTGVGYAIYCSTDLVHWSALQTNTLVGTYTNLTFAASNSSQFYRAQWVP